MALVKTVTGFAIEYDCKLMSEKPARIMDIAYRYNMVCKTILEAIAAAAQDSENRGDLIYELTLILEAALPDQAQTELMFENIGAKEIWAYKEAS